jgi:hypothetical protein
MGIEKTMERFEIIEQKKLSSDTVRRLVLKSVELVRETRDDLNLPLFKQIEKTGERLKHGIFRAESFLLRWLSHFVYAKAYGYFKSPSTIVLDEDLSSSGKLFNQPLLATTATYYCAVHEVIHADDYTDNNKIIRETLRHIERKHMDKLAEASSILSRHSRRTRRRGQRVVMKTWAYQYVDSATHYRAYLVLKHKKFPKIDNIWVSLYNSIFSPTLFTTIEKEKGLQYTVNLLSEQIGRMCIVEIVKEFEKISQKKARAYTV